MTDAATRVYDVWPNRVVIGAGTATRAGVEIARLGCTRVLVVTDPVLIEQPPVRLLLEGLRAAMREVYVYHDVRGDPTDRDIEELLGYMAEVGPEGIVAVGGGSPLDAAKCANLLFTHGGAPADFVRGGPRAVEAGRLLPLVAVPTTAGTASEVTSVAVVIDSDTGRKLSVGGPPLVPSVAVLDAEMTVSLPPHLTAATGMDALTHLIEAYVSSEDFAPADGIALTGMGMVRRVLPAVVADGSDLGLREEMLVAAMMGGIAFNHNRLGLTHAMAHQLTTVCGIHHGLANGILLPYVMSFNLPVRPERYAAVARALGEETPTSSAGAVRALGEETPASSAGTAQTLGGAPPTLATAPEGATAGPARAAPGARAIEIVAELGHTVGLPPTLAEVGVTPGHIPAMAEAALADSAIRKNPRAATRADVEALYRAAHDGRPPLEGPP